MQQPEEIGSLDNHATPSQTSSQEEDGRNGEPSPRLVLNGIHPLARAQTQESEQRTTSSSELEAVRLQFQQARTHLLHLLNNVNEGIRLTGISPAMMLAIDRMGGSQPISLQSYIDDATVENPDLVRLGLGAFFGAVNLQNQITNYSVLVIMKSRCEAQLREVEDWLQHLDNETE